MPPIGMPFLVDDDDDDEDLFVDKHVTAAPITSLMVKQELWDNEQYPVNSEQRPVFYLDGVGEIGVVPIVTQEPIQLEAAAPGAAADNDSLGIFVDRYEWDR